MRIGIIAAMKSEMNHILENMKGVSEEQYIGNIFYSGTINNNEIILCESGVGKVNAASAATVLINTYEVELIINTGIAGGLKDTKTKDVIVAKGIIYSDFDIRIFGYEYGQVPHLPKVMPINPEMIMLVKSTLNKLNIKYREGIILSGDTFVTDLNFIKMVDREDALAVEMEGGGVAQVAVKSGVNFISLRYISDLVGAPTQNDDYKNFEDEMSLRSSKICIKLVENI